MNIAYHIVDEEESSHYGIGVVVLIPGASRFTDRLIASVTRQAAEEEGIAISVGHSDTFDHDTEEDFRALPQAKFFPCQIDHLMTVYTSSDMPDVDLFEPIRTPASIPHIWGPASLMLVNLMNADTNEIPISEWKYLNVQCISLDMFLDALHGLGLTTTMTAAYYEIEDHLDKNGYDLNGLTRSVFSYAHIGVTPDVNRYLYEMKSDNFRTVEDYWKYLNAILFRCMQEFPK